MQNSDTIDQRRHERFRLEPMYTSVTLQSNRDGILETIEGHAYDVSESGVRFEVDQSPTQGDRVSICLQLPGESSGIFVAGQVVWVNEEQDDPAARRAAVEFSRFLTEDDHSRLVRYLGSNARRIAA